LSGSRQQWGRWIAAAALGACVGAAVAQDSLCEAGEPLVFSCHIGHKTLSLCRPSALRQELIYRFGTRGKPELALPEPGSRAAPDVALSTEPLYGGGITSVTFRRGAWEYRVYSKASRAEDPQRSPQVEDGVVIARSGKPVRRLVCDDGGQGFREELGWLPQAGRR
jgi:hypothetical protein